MKAFVIAMLLAAQSGGGFKPAGKMTSYRVGQTSTALPNGKILIVGGRDNVTPVGFPTDCEPYTNLASTELYDPSTGTFTASGSMTQPRVGHTATLLANGKVLIVGGDAENRSEFNDCVSLLGSASAELYDASTGRFTTIGIVDGMRWEHTATLLRDGRVLIVGPGQQAKIYNPQTQPFFPSGLMQSPRWGHTATLLNDGKVLVTGGFNPDECTNLDTAELFDPSTGFFTPVGNMSTNRYAHSAVLLPNGKVLITGGSNNIRTVDSAEVYDPATRTFAPAGKMTRSRSGHSMTFLPSGELLIAGGDATGRPSAELYNPADGTFSATTSMDSYRSAHTANLLSNGMVLMTGGGAGTYSTASDTAEIYDPNLPAPTPQTPRKPARDFNGDGKSDILWRNPAGAVSMWMLNSDKGDEDRFVLDVWPGWTIEGIGDFNGDQRSEVLWRHPEGQVVIWLMDGPVVFGFREVGVTPKNWTAAGVADFNGDGTTDILWHDPAGKAVMWLMDGFAIASSATIGDIGARWTIAGAADFDRDGKADILWRHQDTGYVAISLMDGLAVSKTLLLGESPRPYYDSNPFDWTITGIGDFDRDGSADILWRDTRGNIFMWLMNDAKVVYKWYISNVWPDWAIVGTGDYNGDGLTDILWRDSVGDVSIWSMDGIALASGTWMRNVGDRNAQ
jgi:hypothetical protein